MKSYNIEGGIDFFAELYKSLDVEENEIKTAEDDNLCLITKEPLTDKHVILKCGHKYNYIPLFNDVKTHKQKFNALESTSGQLKHNEIRCPYCRNKQNELLPYYEELGLSKIHGVNYIDPARLIHKLKNQNIKCCSYLTPNPGYNPEEDDPTETNQTNIGNCKYFKCLHGGYYDLSKFIEEYTGPEMLLCYYHKTKTVKDYNKMIKDKKNQDDKLQKEEEKKVKKELLLKVKQEKMEAKLKAKKTKETKIKETKTEIKETEIKETENVVLNGCCEVLKNGPKKGSHCGCKVYQENKCKRHLKKETPNINTDTNINTI